MVNALLKQLFARPRPDVVPHLSEVMTLSFPSGHASSAALAHTGGGRVTENEVGDEDGYYEVEITRADGSQVDVHLHRDFNILSTIADSDAANEK